MKTASDLYYDARLLVNQLSRGVNLDLPVPAFVALFNREQRRWLQQSLLRTGDSDGRDELAYLLDTVDLPARPDALAESVVMEGFRELPSAKLKRLRPLAYYRTQPQLLVGLDARPVDLSNLDEVLRDPLNNPSWDWRETVYTTGSEGVRIYLAPDFMIDRVRVSYYRYPADIDLNGYTTDAGSASQTVDPELDAVSCDQIVDRLAKEAFRIWENTGGFNLAADRVTTD